MIVLILLIIALLIALISLWLKIRHNDTQKLVKYATVLSIILLLTSGTIIMYDVTNPEAITKSVSKGKQHRQKKLGSNISEEKIRKINIAIAESLADDKKHLSNGDPNIGYKYSDKIHSIEYLSNNKIEIKVNNEFFDNNENQKKSTIDSAQNCAYSGIMDSRMVSGNELRKGLYATIKYKKNVVGHSKKSDFKHYKWIGNVSKE
ncbi:hypothetical protein [Companilactobacillus ginsenosidimutans]|uniref:Uncharacterized protein n=1 Tax=Companilactobacillus ginsenosidimutans TaxID=1007676 RepID=A0A0H4QIC7_9LACO|nr:hypothetical protein [Companilactobacillus ginsenosidimutans]AKP68189.1 hypothetical protein ABM34_12025 [Companilactobacillus ginsenosidimutans]